MIDNKPTFDREKFLAHFQGMEDVGQFAVDTFLETLPNLVKDIETAIQNKNPADLEIAAHTLKGVLSNFYADASKLKAWELEQLGHGKDVHKADDIFIDLKTELDKLVVALSEFKNGGLKGAR